MIMRAVCLAAVLAVCPVAAGAAELVVKESPYDVPTTLDRLASILTDKGITIFARIDHAENAAGAGLKLEPLQLLMFGDPSKGTVLMLDNPAVGIDLPMKAVAWRDATGTVQLAYEDPLSIAEERDLGDATEMAGTMSAALDALTDQAVAP